LEKNKGEDNSVAETLLQRVMHIFRIALPKKTLKLFPEIYQGDK
jgi:hypothetical protein